MIDHQALKLGRMGKLPAKEPCAECPLGRGSKPGFLGGYTGEQYLDVLHGIADIACHMSKGFPATLEDQRSCTGVAMYRANNGIVPSGNANAAVEHVGPNRVLAFASPAEFAAHHSPQVPWRIFLNGKFSYVLHAATGEDAIRQVNQRLGNIKAADTNIKAYRANSASD